jgi:hypothetical protein
MAEATSTLTTAQATGIWHTQLTTIEQLRMATTNLVTSFDKTTPAASPPIHRSTSLTNLSLLVVRPDVASLLPLVRTPACVRDIPLTVFGCSVDAAENAKSNAPAIQEMVRDARRVEALA